MGCLGVKKAAQFLVSYMTLVSAARRRSFLQRFCPYEPPEVAVDSIVYITIATEALLQHVRYPTAPNQPCWQTWQQRQGER